MTTENRQAGPTAATPGVPAGAWRGSGASCWGLGPHVGAGAQPWAGLAGGWGCGALLPWKPLECSWDRFRLPSPGRGSPWCLLGFELQGAGTVDLTPAVGSAAPLGARESVHIVRSGEGHVRGC